MGSSLAGSLSAPLLIRESKEGSRPMMKALADLKIEELLAVVSDPVRLPRWADGKDRRLRIVTAREAQDEVVGRLGPQNVRTVVLARVPDQSLCVGQTAWLRRTWDWSAVGRWCSAARPVRPRPRIRWSS